MKAYELIKKITLRSTSFIIKKDIEKKSYVGSLEKSTMSLSTLASI